MTSTDKYVMLIERLLRNTQRGELEWKETATGNAFQVAFPKYSLTISEDENRREETLRYTIVILNSEGTVIDAFSDEDLSEAAQNKLISLTQGSYFQRMRELYIAARRHALGTEEALDAILTELNPDR
jgi:hypothetical protein